MFVFMFDLSFSDHSIDFVCKYPRSVQVDEDFAVIGTNEQTDSVEATGFIPYEMNVEVGEIGETSTVTITPKHSIPIDTMVPM